jgi:hypothetical protein
VPSHLAEQRRKAMERDPTQEPQRRTASLLNEPEEHFERWKVDTLAACSPHFAKMRLTLNRVLVAIYNRPSGRIKFKSGGSLETHPDYDQSANDIYQGSAGLVILMGPRCFEDSGVLTWTDADKYKVGDWVVFQRGWSGGYRMHVNGVECYNFDNERGIRGVVPRPDLVY